MDYIGRGCGVGEDNFSSNSQFRINRGGGVELGSIAHLVTFNFNKMLNRRCIQEIIKKVRNGSMELKTGSSE